MKYNTIIIGGGAAGMCTAIMAKKENNSVLILEHTGQCGKKILSTGNGKCNLTNAYCKAELFDENPEGIYPYYTHGSRDFVAKCISQFDADDAIAFFQKMGLLTLNKNGYIYPRSEQASVVCEFFRNKCLKKGVEIVTDYGIFSITVLENDPEGYRFCIDNKYFAKSLVIATGGKSAAKTGSDGSGYMLASSLGHSIIDPKPALCAVNCSDKFFKNLQGVRTDARITLYDKDKKCIASISGNIQFTEYGISGIPVFQISQMIGEMLDEGLGPVIKIDLIPEMDHDSLRAFIDSFGKDYDLSGILNKKLARTVADEAKGPGGCRAPKSQGERLAGIIKGFRVTPASLRSFEESQVTSGGVSTDEICPETMASRIVKGLYFAGEVVDVNGICGGYNLQWAWSSAHAAATDILKND